MADLLIKGLHLPRDWEMLSINIDRDGKVTRSSDLRCEQIAEAVIVPPHGRLIDTDVLLNDVRKNSESYFADDFAHEWVDRQPTVIEASEVE